MRDERAQVAADLHLEGEIAPAVSRQTERSAWLLAVDEELGRAVTIASAMSGTVSETRAICAPTLRTVDRPTISSISEPLTASRTTLAERCRSG